jgi:sugar/nucleoside kinase (ribokinase family)
VTALDVCVVGELNLDLLLYGLPESLSPDRELLASDCRLTLGSSSAIFAHNLAALGTRVGLLTLVGPDPLGQIALERLQEAKVETSRVARRHSGIQTGLTVILAYSGYRHILTYPGTMFDMRLEDLDFAYMLSARHLHLSSFFLHRALRPDIPQLFRRAKDAGLTTSLDTNDDPEDRWGHDVIDTLKFVDILFQNEREACRLAGTADLDAAVAALSRKVSLLVIKRGSHPAIACRGSQRVEASPPPMEIVDTVGAGDSFDAGFMHEFLRGKSLDACLRLGNLAGAVSTTRPGGVEAFRDPNYIQAFLQQHASHD